MKFNIAKWGHGGAIRLPTKILGGLQASIGDTLIGEFQGSTLCLRKQPDDLPANLVDLVKGLGFDPSDAGDLARLSKLLQRAVATEDSKQPPSPSSAQA